MKLAVVFPTYSHNSSLIGMEIKNARQWYSLCDDLIIAEDGGMIEGELARIADLYLWHPNVGVCNNMLYAWKIALLRGADYVALMDSDVSWEFGNLREMCMSNKVTVPTVNQYPDTQHIAPMLVVPREIAETIGMYEECTDNKTHRNEGFDAAYYQKIKDLVVKVPEFRVDHIGSATRSQL